VEGSSAADQCRQSLRQDLRVGMQHHQLCLWPPPAGPCDVALQVVTEIDRDEIGRRALNDQALRSRQLLSTSPVRHFGKMGEVKKRLGTAGLRPTRPRLALAAILFGNGHRHLTAEMLLEEAHEAKVSISLATVYNTLRYFKEAGLLRQVAVDSAKTYFDTNSDDHHHFYLEEKHQLIDFSDGEIALTKMPIPPADYEVVSVDVVVRLRRTPARS
jgi:Fur family transcriptional regulator, iron response regulator